jgi:SpoVK/Ycf46/Vps4 family AAA+-type ATPase
MASNNELLKEIEIHLSSASTADKIDDFVEAYKHYTLASRMYEDLAYLLLDKKAADETLEKAKDAERHGLESLEKANLSPEEKEKVILKKEDKTLSGFVGFDNLKEYLMDSIVKPWKANALNTRNKNAIFIYGPDGCGKTALIESLIHELGATGHFVEATYASIVDNPKGAKYQWEYVLKKGMEKDNVVFYLDAPDGYFPQEKDKVSKKTFKIFSKLFKKQLQLIRKKNLNILIIASTPNLTGLNLKIFQQGMFDDVIRIHHPDRVTRKEIFLSRLAGYDIQISLDDLVKTTHGYITKDVSRLCRSLKKMANLYAKDGQKPVIDDVILNKVLPVFEKTDEQDFASVVANFEKNLPSNIEIIDKDVD